MTRNKRKKAGQKPFSKAIENLASVRIEWWKLLVGAAIALISVLIPLLWNELKSDHPKFALSPPITKPELGLIIEALNDEASKKQALTVEFDGLMFAKGGKVLPNIEPQKWHFSLAGKGIPGSYLKEGLHKVRFGFNGQFFSEPTNVIFKDKFDTTFLDQASSNKVSANPELVKKILNLFEDGKEEEALNILHQLKSEIANPEFEEAKNYLRLGQYLKAIESFKNLLKSDLSDEYFRETSEYLVFAYLVTEQSSFVPNVFITLLGKDSTYTPSEKWWDYEEFMKYYFKGLGSLGINPRTKLPEKVSIGVEYFSDTSQDRRLRYLRKALGEMLITDLAQIIDFQLLERIRIQFLLNELQLSSSGIAEEDSAVRIGSIIEPDILIIGSLSHYDDKIRIIVHLVRLRKIARNIKTISVEDNQSNFFNMEKSLFQEILKAIKLEQGSLIKEKRQIKIKAIEAYRGALYLASRSNYVEAYKKLNEALQISPNYTSAKELIKILSPLVFKKS